MTRADLKSVTDSKFEVPEGVRVYEIAGPLFFGAAKTAMETLAVVGKKDHTIILAMQHVPIDRRDRPGRARVGARSALPLEHEGDLRRPPRRR